MCSSYDIFFRNFFSPELDFIYFPPPVGRHIRKYNVILYINCRTEKKIYCVD
jgi:hypothetical protein